MSWRPPTSVRRPRVEMIPLIDMFFLLLVFFLFGVFSMTMQRGLLVDLPSAQTATTTQDDTLAISITADGQLALQEEPVTLEALPGRLASYAAHGDEPLVLIHADERVRHGLVVSVLDAVRHAGLARVSIQAQPAVP